VISSPLVPKLSNVSQAGANVVDSVHSVAALWTIAVLFMTGICHFLFTTAFGTALRSTQITVQLVVDLASEVSLNRREKIIYLNNLKTKFIPNSAPKIQFVPHRKYYTSSTKTYGLMIFAETAPVYCAIHMEHPNTLCETKCEVLAC
jgi:hypothetical protein